MIVLIASTISKTMILECLNVKVKMKSVMNLLKKKITAQSETKGGYDRKDE